MEMNQTSQYRSGERTQYALDIFHPVFGRAPSLIAHHN